MSGVIEKHLSNRWEIVRLTLTSQNNTDKSNLYVSSCVISSECVLLHCNVVSVSVLKALYVLKEAHASSYPPLIAVL